MPTGTSDRRWNVEFFRRWDREPTQFESNWLSIQVHRLGEAKATSGWSVLTWPRRFFSLGIITQGSGVYQASGRRWPLSPGSLFVIFQGARQCEYHTEDHDLISHIWVCFSGSGATAVLERLGLTVDTPVAEGSDTWRQGVRTLHDVRVEIEKEPGDELLLYGLFWQALAQLSGGNAQDRSIGVGVKLKQEEILQSAARHLNSSVASGVSIGDLAKSVGYSRSHFSTIFSSYFGCSPFEYFQRRRLEYVKELLVETDHTISEIASRLGYSDPSQFSRLFRRMTGVSPSHYRRRSFGSRSDIEHYAMNPDMTS